VDHRLGTPLHGRTTLPGEQDRPKPQSFRAHSSMQPGASLAESGDASMQSIREGAPGIGQGKTLYRPLFPNQRRGASLLESPTVRERVPALLGWSDRSSRYCFTEQPRPTGGTRLRLWLRAPRRPTGMIKRGNWPRGHSPPAT